MACDLQQSDWQNGDILAFSGHGPTSLLIRGATCSSISHVGGVCYVTPEAIQQHLEATGRVDATGSTISVLTYWKPRFLLFESTTLSDLPCEITGLSIHGVQAHTPEKRIEQYNGKIWRYRMTQSWYQTFDENDGPRKLSEKLLALIGTQYDRWEAINSGTHLLKHSKFWAILRSLLPGVKANHDKQLFCSEYLVSVLQHLGMFGLEDAGKINPAELISRLVSAGVLEDEPVLLKG